MAPRTALLSFFILLAPIAAIHAALAGRGLPPSDVEGGAVVDSDPITLRVSLTPAVTVQNASAAQLGRLVLALDRFRAASLKLPDIDIQFSIDESGCMGHMGRFDPGPTPWRISICSHLDFVYEHELAHAWERATMTDETRQAFMTLRGLTIWSDSVVPWNERGVEGVAFIIQQGLAGLPLPPVLGAEGLSRMEAFELLTGRPAPRLVEWIRTRDVACVDRPTTLSRALPDKTGSSCGQVEAPTAPRVPIPILRRSLLFGRRIGMATGVVWVSTELTSVTSPGKAVETLPTFHRYPGPRIITPAFGWFPRLLKFLYQSNRDIASRTLVSTLVRSLVRESW
jgi:hypothetical protein